MKRCLLYTSIKSAIGLGLILNQGIGDTIRVSLTGDVVEEIKSAKLILRTLGLRKGGIEVVSCPTCGRTKIDQISLANQVEALAAQFPNLDIKVAVMGCVVNGPGEAKEADLGIAGGKMCIRDRASGKASERLSGWYSDRKRNLTGQTPYRPGVWWTFCSDRRKPAE